MERVMKMRESKIKLYLRAAEALKRALSEVSTIKVKEIRHKTAARTGFVVYVDVVGHAHALACKVNAHPEDLRAALEELRDGAAQVSENATPVLIAPYLSPEAQTMCKDCRASFLDLEGNARISLGEVFIVKRTMQPQMKERVALDPVLLQNAEVGAAMRPPAPLGFIAANFPGVPVRMRESVKAGAAVA